MTITLGRVGVSVANGGDGTSWDDPHTIARQGGVLTLEGLHTASTQAELVWWARQFLGLGEGEEPVVPFTCSTEPTLDGFYRVLDVQVAHEQGSTRASGYLRWQAKIEELRSFRQPKIELLTVYGLQLNAHSITTYDALVGVPGPSLDVDPPFTADSNGTRSVAEGSSIVYVADGGASTTLATGRTDLVVPAASYYHGSVKIEHDLGSSTFRHVTGRGDFPAVASPSSRVLRLGNGLVRLVVTYGNASVSDFSVQWWDGSQWDTATEFYVEGVGTHGELTYNAVQVLRNTAEFATIRLVASAASIGIGTTYVDVSLRRGLRALHVFARSTTAAASGWRLGFTTSTASTTLTGGLRRTSNNGGGNRELLATVYSHTKDLTNGRLTVSTSLGTDWFIGCEVAGSSATGQNTQANQFDEMFCLYSEVAQVVAN